MLLLDFLELSPVLMPFFYIFLSGRVLFCFFIRFLFLDISIFRAFLFSADYPRAENKLKVESESEKNEETREGKQQYILIFYFGR